MEKFLKSKNLKEVIILLIILSCFITVNVHDLKDWYYSFIGDEYAFFDFAQNIIHGAKINILSQQGVYGYHPVLDSVFQALIMKLFGADNFGWRMSSVISASVAIILTYFFAKTLFDKQIAVISTIIFASSHYLLAFTHIGYNNLNSLTPTLLSFIFLAKFINDSSNKKNVFLSGVFSALGFYTFYSARLTFPIILFFLLLKPLKNSPKIFFFTLGFLILFLPFLITNKQALVSYPLKLTIKHQEFTGFQFSNILYTFSGLFLPEFIPTHHFVSGSLLDVFSAFFLLVGTCYLCKNIKQAKYQILLFWIVIGIILISGLFYKLEVPITRLHYVLPPLSIIAGIGLSKLSQNKLSIIFCLVIIIFFNLYRFDIETPKEYHTSKESLVIKTLQKTPNVNIYHYSPKPLHPVLSTAISSYGFTNRYFPISKLTDFPKSGILISYESLPNFNSTKELDDSGKSFIYKSEF